MNADPAPSAACDARDADTRLYNEVFMREMLSRLFQLYDRGNGPGISVFLLRCEGALDWPERALADADVALRAQVAEALAGSTRGSDIPVCLDDGSFAVFLIGARPDMLASVAERVCRSIRAWAYRDSLAGHPPLLDGGIAMRRQRESIESLLERASTALQEARAAGRNQVRTAVDYFPV